MITLYISIKTQIFRHMEFSKNGMAQRHGHKNNLIGTAAGGVSKLVPFKTTNAALNRSLSSSLFNLLADDLEASLDTRL